MKCVVHFTYCGAVLDVAVEFERYRSAHATAVQIAMNKLSTTPSPYGQWNPNHKTWLEYLDLKDWDVVVMDQVDLREKCTRTACENEEDGFVHRDSKNRYCASCARRINEYNPNLVTYQESFYETVLKQPNGIHFLPDLSYPDRGVRK